VTAPVQPPDQVLACARLVTDRARGSLGGRLRAAYLHGSAVLGGWRPDRSDVDLLLVTEDGAGHRDVDALAAVLSTSAAEAPGRGLECSAVTAGQAARPRPPWPFLLHVAVQRSGAQDPGDTRVRAVRGKGHPGDPDLLMHYAVCRAAGWAVYGPGPRDVIGSVPRPAILGYLAAELGWGLEHGTEAYAVLNAARAQVFLADGRIVSKIEGGRVALARGLGPPAVLRRALGQQQGRAPDRAAGEDAVSYTRAVAADLQSATGAATGPA
jgi:Domain of unknown function (DUF4111)